MHPAGLRIGAAAALALAGLTAAGAQARRIHEYRLHEQEDRGAPFAMTVGPDGTVYTLIPRRDGNWILSEVKNWWQEKPAELGIDVEGFPARPPVTDWDQMLLAVTPDGQYLVTVISANLRAAPDDPYPADMIVEFVRLADFSVTDTDHMRALGMRGRLHGGVDRAGHLLIRSEIAAQGGDSAAPFDTWFDVSVPEMKPQLVCSYNSGDAMGMEGSCGEFAKTEGYASAGELAQSVWPAPPATAPVLPAGAEVSAKDRWQTATVRIEGKPLTLLVVNGVSLQVYEPQ